MGQQPLTLGAGLGGQAAAYGANAGNSLLRGGLSAALTQQAGSSYSPLGGLLQGAARDPQLRTGFEKLFSGGQPIETGYTGAPTMSPYDNEQLANSFQYGDSSGYYQPQRSF